MYRNNLSEKSKEYIMNYIKAELISRLSRGGYPPFLA